MATQTIDFLGALDGDLLATISGFGSKFGGDSTLSITNERVRVDYSGSAAWTGYEFTGFTFTQDPNIKAILRLASGKISPSLIINRNVDTSCYFVRLSNSYVELWERTAGGTFNEIVTNVDFTVGPYNVSAIDGTGTEVHFYRLGDLVKVKVGGVEIISHDPASNFTGGAAGIGSYFADASSDVSYDDVVIFDGAQVGSVLSPYNFSLQGGYPNGLGGFTTVPNNPDEYNGLIPNKFVTAAAVGGGDGSSGSPWTLYESMTNAVAGNIVGIDTGLYVGSGVSTGGRDTPVFEPANSGTISQPIRFVAKYMAYESIVDASEVRSGLTVATTITALQPVFGSNGRDYIQWIGLYSNNYELDNLQRSDTGLCTIWNGIGNIVSKCRFIADPTRNDAYWTDNNYSGVRLENTSGSEINYNHIEGFDTVTGAVNTSAVICYETEKLATYSNYFKTCGNAIQMKGSFGTYNNSESDFYYNLVDGCGTMYKMHAQHDVLSNVHNNSCINTLSLSSITSAAGVLTFGNIRFFNNSFYGTAPGSGVSSMFFVAFDWVGKGTASGVEYFNNIIIDAEQYLVSTFIVGNSYAIISDLASFDYNCQYNNAVVITTPDAADLNWASWQAVGEDANSSITDPQFVSTTDLHLQIGSPALTAGKDTYNFYEGGVDAIIPQGAYVTGSEIIGNGVNV